LSKNLNEALGYLLGVLRAYQLDVFKNEVLDEATGCLLCEGVVVALLDYLQ